MTGASTWNLMGVLQKKLIDQDMLKETVLLIWIETFCSFSLFCGPKTFLVRELLVVFLYSVNKTQHILLYHETWVMKHFYLADFASGFYTSCWNLSLDVTDTPYLSLICKRSSFSKDIKTVLCLLAKCNDLDKVLLLNSNFYFSSICPHVGFPRL